MSCLPSDPLHSTYDDIKRAVPLRELILALGLPLKGRSFRCPNAAAHKHGDRNHSAHVASTWKSWTCFACGAKGTVIDLYAYAHQLPIADAKTALAEYAGLIPAYGAVTLPAPDLPPIPTPLPGEPATPAGPGVAAFLAATHAALRTHPDGQSYLAARGIPLPLALSVGLGYAQRGTWPNPRGHAQPRIVAPLTTPDGILLTLYGRSTVRCDKALRHDFLSGARGVFHAPALATEGCVLVEGVFDALACLAGGKAATAFNGLSIRHEWWGQIPASRIILATDNDAPGQQRRAELEPLAQAAGKHMRFLPATALGPCKDLNEFWATYQRLPECLLAPLEQQFAPLPPTPAATPST